MLLVFCNETAPIDGTQLGVLYLCPFRRKKVLLCRLTSKNSNFVILHESKKTRGAAL